MTPTATLATQAAPPSLAWWQGVRAQADQPPAQARSALWLHAQGAPRQIGSLAPPLAELLALPQRGEPAWVLPWQAGWMLRPGSAHATLHDGSAATDALLAALAASLRERRLAGPWRDELLAVDDAQGLRLGAIERGAVRPLGIVTHAVHLAGRSADGRHWIQQRSARKANDPGKLDTLMGGMISAADTLASALARETWEEAGLHLDALSGLRAAGRVTIRRPSSQAEGLGWVHEHIDCYEAVLPDGMLPANQDGEVDAFHCMSSDELRLRLERDEFTLEAALVLGAVLRWPQR